MADWNAYEARIRDRALCDAVQALKAAGWDDEHGAVRVVLELRPKPQAHASGVTQSRMTAPAAQLPIPPRRRSGMQYPFDTMSVGDHFDSPRNRGMTENNSDRRQKSIMAAAKAWRKRRGSGAQFTTRLIDDNTVRCWRTA